MSEPALPTHTRTRRARWLAQAGRVLFGAGFLGIAALLAVLSTRYPVTMDWTASARNTLSAPSVELLRNMPERIHVRAFIGNNMQLREAARQLLARYQRVHPQLSLEFIDPQREPREAQRLGVRNDGEMVFEYAGKRENVSGFSEASVTNALSRLARGGDRWVGVMTGRGERDWFGNGREDLGQFVRHLQSVGTRIQPIDIGGSAPIADNVSVVVIAQPAVAWSEQDLQAITAWIDNGGNVLWLADTGGITPAGLARHLGIVPEQGLLVDPSSQLNGQVTPEFIVVNGYASHAVTAGLTTYSAFPTATSLSWVAPQGWQYTGIAASGLRSWRETGDLSQAVRFDADQDLSGPLDLAVTGRRKRPRGEGEQRIAVFGDIDFLSNAYLGLGANRVLGTNIVQWLDSERPMIAIPVVMAPDLDYAPTQSARAVIALAAPIALPVVVLIIGLVRWRARRRR